MNALGKMAVYLRASSALGGLNLAGFPAMPKHFYARSAANRQAYNEFILWMTKLGLHSVRQVIDVGANHGDFAAAAAALYPSSQLLLVEPQPDLHAQLVERGKFHGARWRTESSAAGAAEATLTLHVSEAQDAVGSLLGFSEEYRLMNPTVGAVREVSCAVRTLDAIAASHEVGEIDLLKVDVEGYEFETMAGAKEVLRRTRAVIVEVSLVRKPEDSVHPVNEMLTLLLGYGFSIVAIIPSIYDQAQPWKPLEFNLLLRR